MFLRDGVHKCKPKSGAAHGAAAGFVHAEKWGEDFLLVFRGNADSGVFYKKHQLVVILADKDGDRTVGAVVFYGIFHQVVDCAVEENIAAGDGVGRLKLT